MSASEYHICIRKGTDWKERMVFQSGCPALAVDISTFKFWMQFRDEEGNLQASLSSDESSITIEAVRNIDSVLIEDLSAGSTQITLPKEIISQLAEGFSCILDPSGANENTGQIQAIDRELNTITLENATTGSFTNGQAIQFTTLGEFTPHMDHETTAALTADRLEFDLMYEDSNGDRDILLEGTADILETKTVVSTT